MKKASGDGGTGEDVATASATDPEHLLEAISSHAVFTLSPDGVILTWPGPARDLYGFDPGSVIAQEIPVLFADEEQQARGSEVLLSEAAHGAVESEAWHERADGSVFWATMTLSPIRNGELLGYVVVSHDTTDKKQYEQMLERQNDRLKEFTDILAHDLRNPLNVIDGLVELYRETGEAEHLATIDETTDRMERLVDDLLRVARQGDVVSDPEPTDIENVVDTAWRGTGGMADGASIVYEPVPSVSADGDRLCELFENLFRNSVEHGGEDVTVRVGPLVDGFYVEDDGPGILADTRETVFDHGFTTTDDGSGYGLSIVRTIASAHGWDVTAVESESGGARFTFTGLEFLE